MCTTLEELEKEREVKGIIQFSFLQKTALVYIKYIGK